jgi:hypothetical protein
MTVKIKFLTPVSQNKFLHNLVNAKKRNANYKHFTHRLIKEKDKAWFTIDEVNVSCEINFYPNDNVADIECQPCDFEKLQSLLVFDLLESINEKAVVRFLDSKFFFNGDVEFYFVSNNRLQKVSNNRNSLLAVDNSRIMAEITRILEEIQRVDFI